MDHAEPTHPSSFFLDHREALKAAGALGPVLDLACGDGRHTLASAALGLAVLAIDRNPASLMALERRAQTEQLRVCCVRSNLETDYGFPIKPGTCGAILVFRFLFRPLAPAIVAALRPGGLLLYETFTLHQRQLASGPKNPAFLLAEGELPGLFPELEVLAFEEVLTEGTHPQALARLCARRPGA